MRDTLDKSERHRSDKRVKRKRFMKIKDRLLEKDQRETIV